MICPRCKSEINDDMSFCPQCGMRIEKCPQCHQPIVHGAKFCSHCGTGLNKNYQESQIGGYYQPLHDKPYQVNQNTQATRSFDDISVNKKVNKKLIIIIVSIFVVVSGLSYWYIYYGPAVNFTSQTQNELPQSQPVEIKGTTSFSTHTGNINNEGHVYQSEDKIYIIDDQGYLIGMDMKLENRITLVSEECDYINVVDNIIYFTNSQQQLSSITTDGKDQKVILNKEIYYLVVKGEKAYYQSQDEGQERIYVYDLKTNQETKLNDHNSYNLNVLDDKIYYSTSDGIYSMGLDGKGEEKLISDKVNNLIYLDQKLYYLSSGGQIMAYDLNTHKTETMIEKSTMLLNITDQYVFYQVDNTIMKYDLQTKKASRVYSSSIISSGQVVGDKMILNTVSSTYGQKDSQYQFIIDFDGNQQQRLFTTQDGSFV